MPTMLNQHETSVNLVFKKSVSIDFDDLKYWITMEKKLMVFKKKVGINLSEAVRVNNLSTQRFWYHHGAVIIGLYNIIRHCFQMYGMLLVSLSTCFKSWKAIASLLASSVYLLAKNGSLGKLLQFLKSLQLRIFNFLFICLLF